MAGRAGSWSLLAVVAALSLPVQPAHAHEGGVALSAVVESVTPRVDGLSVSTLLSVAPVLEVRNETGAEAVVLGEHGEPFLRIGPDGVFGNTRSPDLHRSTDPLDSRPVPSEADASAPAEWQRLDSSRAWRWFDPRMRLHPRRGERIGFEVPVLVGATYVIVRGYVREGEVGHFSTRLTTPSPDGLAIRLLEGAIPALFVRNDTGRLLDVPGLDGEPFLRIGPDGVHANTRSPTYWLAAGQTIRPVPPEADAEAEPTWAGLSSTPAWAWLEYRARVPGRGMRPFDLGPRPETVLRWSTPLTLGGRDLQIEGQVDWTPLPEALDTGNSMLRLLLTWGRPAGATLILALGLWRLGTLMISNRRTLPVTGGTQAAGKLEHRRIGQARDQ